MTRRSFQVESTIDIAAPPMRVWRILCDFKSYPHWNPYREIEGDAALGAKVVLSIGSAKGPRRRLGAVITVFQAGELLAFETGRPLLSRATEMFLLEPIPRGTRLRHRAEMSGITVMLIGRDRLMTNLLSVYGAVDKALKEHAASPAKALRSSRPPGGRAK